MASRLWTEIEADRGTETWAISGVDPACTTTASGMKPSVDANNLVCVSEDGERYIHADCNINTIPAAANIAENAYPLPTINPLGDASWQPGLSTV